MSVPRRFSDAGLRLSDFYDEVWVVCPACSKNALARAYREVACARLTCTACGYSRDVSTRLSNGGVLLLPAHRYFNAALWLQMPLRDGETVAAFNGAHLNYLEQYIAADLREHRNRTHFTLLEKLPRFYHEASNRTALLKIIQQLREKG
ncbi:MAG TPA: hypothetical protein PKE63_00655 [Lacibacter sp.]|nr:hypothetical protein [Lacibacter sp.]HMO88338.1 hypothetical protein [Lacibacter sp.]HMP85752.1 hypothetical protein [Lacibacter sp.]